MLCTSNGADRLHEFDQVAALGMICGIEVVWDRRVAA